MTIPSMVCSLGNETDPWAFIGHLVLVFRGVRRVLSEDGALWLNLGDSYAGGGGFAPDAPSNMAGSKQTTQRGAKPGGLPVGNGIKAKDLTGIPWRAAFALQAEGWYLRSDVIWSKPNPMPESVADRPTKAHEYVFLLSKGPRYFFDQDAVAEPALRAGDIPGGGSGYIQHSAGGHNKDGLNACSKRPVADTRNLRSVWTIATQPFSGAHFATFPPELPERCIKAGSAVGDTVLDPFNGAGTTGLVAGQLGRDYIGIELNPDYADMARQRLGLPPADDRRDVVKAKAVEGLPLFGGAS
jgi:DNA modification methylase